MRDNHGHAKRYHEELSNVVEDKEDFFDISGDSLISMYKIAEERSGLPLYISVHDDCFAEWENH